MGYLFNPFSGTFDNTGLYQSYLDTRYIKKSGDTMTGNLVMSGIATQITFPDNSDNTGGLSFGSDNVKLYHSSTNQLKLTGELKLAIFSNTSDQDVNKTPIFIRGANGQNATIFVIQDALSSQNGNLFEMWDSGGGTINQFTADGRLSLRYIGGTSFTLAVGIGYDGYGGVLIKENSNSQSNNDLEIQNSSASKVFSVGVGGKINNYNNIATVSGGVPSELAKIDSTGLTGNVGATLLYSVPSSGAGMYRVSVLIVETTAGSVSSTLPNAQIVYTDNETGGSITIDATPILGVAGIGQTGALTTNTIGTTVTGVICINAKASTNINYQTVNYASNLAGMAYAIHIKLEAL